MTPYRNLSGDSGVAEYEPGDDYIKVRFVHSNDVYTYDSARPGANHVTEMKRLAALGRGLSAYIATHINPIKKNYSRKE